MAYIVGPPTKFEGVVLAVTMVVTVLLFGVMAWLGGQ
jgi:hypothetical protein